MTRLALSVDPFVIEYVAMTRGQLHQDGVMEYKFVE